MLAAVAYSRVACPGNTVEKTFRAGEKVRRLTPHSASRRALTPAQVDAAEMNKSQNQFTYMDGEEFVFMNLESFEEIKLPRDDSWAKYLKEGMSVSVLTWNGKIIGVEMPNSVVLKVVETAGSDAGNTKGAGAQKPATLETGAVINVPMFINGARAPCPRSPSMVLTRATVGELIMVDTRNDLYLSKQGGPSFQ